MPVQKGDVLLIPSDIDSSHRVTVKWQQMFKQQTANYYAIVTKNRTQDNAEVVFFIATEWYEGSGDATQHITHVAQKDTDGFYQLTVDEKCQYGPYERAATRFVVYHDKKRKPLEGRFLEASLASHSADVSEKVAGLLGHRVLPGSFPRGCTPDDYLSNF